MCSEQLNLPSHVQFARLQLDHYELLFHHAAPQRSADTA